MLKHVGRHGDRKVAIVFREIPNEDHMCLVIYPDVLPTHIHNSVMSVLESAPGQQATNLADVFHRNLLPDGRNILQTLHAEGMLKKVAANQVILTPTPNTSVKLDEVNKLVKEMESGAEALKRMQEIDQNQGIVDPAVKRQAEQAFKRKQLEEHFKAEDSELAAQQEMIQEKLADLCEEIGVDSLKTPYGSASKSIKTRYWTRITRPSKVSPTTPENWIRLSWPRGTTITTTVLRRTARRGVTTFLKTRVQRSVVSRCTTSSAPTRKLLASLVTGRFKTRQRLITRR
mgnify:CR=1 FL=1